MYRSLLIPVCAAAIVSMLSIPAFAADRWRMVDSKNGIMVFLRPSASHNSNEFKVVAVINAKIEVLVAVLRDIPAFPLWMAHCDVSQLLEHEDDDRYLFHFVQNLPWPAKDRDMVIQATAARNWEQGWFKVDFNTTQYAGMPPTAGLIRMTASGSFLLEFIDRHHTQVTFSINADPAGMMPAFVVNRIGRKLTYQTILNMRQIVREKKYARSAEKSRDKFEIEKTMSEGGILPRTKLVPSEHGKTAVVPPGDSTRLQNKAG